MYAGSREIGQPRSYLAQASFRKFVCVRGSVSSVLRCVRRRNEYRNNVSIGMTRRSFYLLNLRRISRDGRGENGKGEERSEEAERKKKRMGNEERRRRRRRWRYDSSFSVYCQYSHRAALKASKISIYLPEARKRDNLFLPRLEWYTGCWITTKREMRFLPLRATIHLRNVAIGNVGWCPIGTPWFRIDDDANENGEKTSKTEWVWNSDILGQREWRNFKADSIGSVDRVAYLATSSLLLMRRERMHVFHGVR